MQRTYDAVVQYLHDSYAATWQWLDGLDRQSWLYLLAITTLLGLMCMRGYGSRNNY